MKRIIVHDGEKMLILARGRELVRRARERNRSVSAKVLEQEVRIAVSEVRKRQKN